VTLRGGLACTLGLGALALAGCTSNGSGSDTAGAVSVSSGSDTCELSTTEAPAGTVTFEVENTGSEVTEFYLYASDGRRVVGEVEDIGPGLTRRLVATVAKGTYITACKPGMKGRGIRANFTVT
jgi:iron uptake system component EfeO